MGPRHVTIGKFAEMTGYTEKAIRHKIDLGVWIEGRVFKRAPDNRILIDIEGYDQWAAGVQEPGLSR
jgi:hypothetical protein